MSQGKLLRNAAMAVLQVFVAGAVLFLLYRYLLRSLGAELVGVWAVVLATASASRIGEMGLAASAVKYTARYLARNEPGKASEVIQTTAITISVVLFCVLMGAYPLIAWLAEKIIPPAHLLIAMEVLPYALASAWIATVANVFLSGLDGCQRIDLRANVSMFGMVGLLAFAWILVPKYGFIGLAWAQIGQGIVLFVGGWVLLRTQIPLLPPLPVVWRRSLFREMFHYGVSFQVTSILGMLVDPVTKALITKFGGVAGVAYYDMANRMVAQFRSILISANQVLVPKVADLHESAPQSIVQLYVDSYNLMFYLSLPMYVAVLVIAPWVSELWVGHYERGFVLYAEIIAVGYWLNTLGAPAHFFSLGTGLLRWNTWAYVVIALLNGALGYLLGHLLSGEGVVLGYIIALTIGGTLIVAGYHHEYKMPIAMLLPRDSRYLLVVCGIALTVELLLQSVSSWNGEVASVVSGAGAVCILAILAASWAHPLRKVIGERLALAIRK